MNNKVKFLRGTSNEYAVAEKDSDTIYFTTDDGKLYIGDKEVSGDGGLTIDDTLSDTSTNPVQNKVVKQAIDNKADKSLYSDTTINVGRLADSTVGNYSTAEGQNTTASGDYSHAEGYKTIASGIGSHAEGSNYFLSGVPSSRKVTISNGEESTIYTIDGSYAYGINSHAEGTRSFAYGSSSHAEGCDTTASGSYSHAEGRDTTASGAYSHAEGDFITASGTYSHAEGYRTIASGSSSHAEGCYTTAGGRYSHAGGYYTKALKVAEFAHGQYNQSNDNTLFSIGDGTSDSARHNAFEITTTGGKLHDNDILTSAQVIQFIPYNLKYYAQNDRILLFSNDDDSVARGIYFINDTPNDIVVCALISATAEGPIVQYGYGSNTYPDIQNTGDGREWFSEESTPTSPTIFAMTVPSGKLGYYGVYQNSESVYTTIHDIRCPYFNFF